MTDKLDTPIVPVTDPVADAPVVDEQSKDTLTAELEALRVELDKNKELLNKVRKFEKENKAAAEAALAEQGKFKELYEAELDKRTKIEQRLTEKAIEDSFKEVLKDSGALSIGTVLKLLDKSKVGLDDNGNVDVTSVKGIVAELKKSDPILFGEPESKGDDKKESVDVKRAADTANVTSYEKEMKAAKSAKEIEEVLRKYGKIK